MSSARRASSVPKPPRWLVEAPLPSQHLRQPLILFDERHLLLGRVKSKAGKPIAHELSFIFVFVCFFQHLTSSLYPVSPHSTPTQPQLPFTALHGGCGRTAQPEYLGRGMSGPLPNPAAGRVSVGVRSHGLPTRHCLDMPQACLAPPSSQA